MLCPNKIIIKITGLQVQRDVAAGKGPEDGGPDRCSALYRGTTGSWDDDLGLRAATSTLLWTIAHVILSYMPPPTRRVAYCTWCPCLLVA